MSDCPYDTTDVDMTDLTANLFAKVSIGKPESGGEETDASYLPTTAIEDPSSADIQMVGPSEIFSSQITSTGHVEESGSKPQDRAQDREMLTDAGKLDHMKDTEDWSRAANALLEYIEAPGTVESTRHEYSIGSQLQQTGDPHDTYPQALSMSSSEEEDVKDDKYVDDEGDFIDSPEPPTFTISEYDVRAGSRPILVKYQLSVPDSSLESGPNHRWGALKSRKKKAPARRSGSVSSISSLEDPFGGNKIRKRRKKSKRAE